MANHCRATLVRSQIQRQRVRERVSVTLASEALTSATRGRAQVLSVRMSHLCAHPTQGSQDRHFGLPSGKIRANVRRTMSAS
jgi:hypothetical protein